MEVNQKKWVSIWGNAVSINENRPEAYSRDISLRYPVYCPFQGDKVRLTLDNYCGKETVDISRASVINGDRIYPVTFMNGYEGVLIAAGDTVVTDRLDIPVKAGDTLEITFYLRNFTQMRSMVVATGPLSSGIYALGDVTAQKGISIDRSRRTNNFYFLSNVSVLTESNKHAIVCYGDSITAQDWPDYLKLRCRDRGLNDTSVVRRATSGSRILREYSCITYESYGLKGTNRFWHEIPTDGADTLIIQQGINDIIHPVGVEVNPFRPMSDLPTIDQLIDGMKWYLDRARDFGLKTYVGTLLPIKGWRTYAPFRDELRNQFNDWIRQCEGFEGCIDFDAALRNPEDPAAFLPEYDSGDHLHPSAEGYKKMAETIPAEILR